jgi:hypothetical protein
MGGKKTRQFVQVVSIGASVCWLFGEDEDGQPRFICAMDR